MVSRTPANSRKRDPPPNPHFGGTIGAALPDASITVPLKPASTGEEVMDYETTDHGNKME